MRKRSKLIPVLAIVALVAFLAISIAPYIITARAASPSELQKSLQDAKNKKAQYQDKINSLTGQKADVVEQKNALDREIADLEDQIGSVNIIIAEKDGQIAEKEQEIADAEAKIAQYDDNFKARVRAMYKQGSLTYLDILFGASDFADLIYRVELVSRIINYDRNILQIMADEKQKIVDAKEVIECERNEQETYRQILSNQEDMLNMAVAKRNEQIAQIDSDIDAARRQAEAEDAAIAELQRQIASMVSSGAASSTSSPSNIKSTGSMIWPTSSGTITSEYGTRFHPIQKVYKTHTGLDIGASYGSPVYAADSGKVILASWNGGYGKCIVVDHGGGISTLYGHNSSLLVSVGQTVQKGQVIAYVGSTGNSTGPHLHFEVMINGKHTNPHAYIG